MSAWKRYRLVSGTAYGQKFFPRSDSGSLLGVTPGQNKTKRINKEVGLYRRERERKGKNGRRKKRTEKC